MAADQQLVAQLLNATLDPQQHKQAEAALKAEESKQGFSLTLLHIIASENLPPNTRLAGALFFKNFIKFNYVDEDGVYKLPQEEVTTIKNELIGLMISVPSSLQTQLGEAISVIADSDFWERWDTLVDDLRSRLTIDDAKANNGVLQVAHSIFKRWRPLFRSDGLFTEVNHVLTKFGEPYVQQLQNTDRQIKAHESNKEVLLQHFETLNLLIKLFYDLSCQDLPPIFEENLSAIMELFHKYLTYDNPLLVTDDEAESGPLEFVKAGICEALTLYMQKYEDVFGDLCQPFITSAWNLLTSIGPESKYDILVSKTLHFLTAVAGIDKHAQSFNNEEILGQVVEKVILPNIALRDFDIEQFEDEPIEYIRRDLEGSDTDSRRRAATDFLQKLLQKYEELVTRVVDKYITHYLTTAAQNPSENWKSKDTAVYLFTATAAKGGTTVGQGVISTNPRVNIVDFFQKNIANDLVAEDVEPISKVDAIKFLYTFRSQLTKEQWQAAFPPLLQALGSTNYVVYTYAAIAVERVLVLTNDAGQHIFRKDEVLPFAKDLINHLFGLIERNQAPEKVQENEFIMRCLMRILIVIKDGVVPYGNDVLQHLLKTTEIISKNPSNPRFYYFHFEAFGSLVRHYAPADQARFEQEVFMPLTTLLQQDVQEFLPYVFQIFAAILEQKPAGNFDQNWLLLVEPLITPAIWDIRGYAPGLARLLAALVPHAKGWIIEKNQVEPILGIFQKLMAGRARTELYSFDVLESLIVSLDTSVLTPYFTEVLKIIYNRLNKDPSESFKRRFVRFYHLVSSRQMQGMGADFFISHTDAVQADIFPPIYLTIILPVTLTLVKPLERKLAVVSLVKTLTDSQAFAVKYAKGWTKTCDALLGLLENAPVLTNEQEVIKEADVDDMSFGVGFTQLNTCKRTASDDWPEIVDVKRWVGEAFKEADSRHSGHIAKFVSERASEQAVAVLASYLK